MNETQPVSVSVRLHIMDMPDPAAVIKYAEGIAEENGWDFYPATLEEAVACIVTCDSDNDYLGYFFTSRGNASGWYVDAEPVK